MASKLFSKRSRNDLVVIDQSRLDVAAAERELADCRRAGAGACAKIEALEVALRAATTYDEHTALERELAAAIWERDHAAREQPHLVAKLTAARDARARGRVAFHQNRIKAAFPALKDAILAAVVAQETIQRIMEAAEADIGQGLVASYLPQLMYRAPLSRQIVEHWAQYNEDHLGRLSAPPPVAAPPVPAFRASAPLRPPEPGGRSGLDLHRAQPIQRPPKASPPAPRSLVAPPPEPPQRSRNPDDMSPLALGEVRVQALVGGFTPDNWRPQCDKDQIIKMPRAQAEAAEKRGAATIIEHGPEVGGAGEGETA